MRREMLLQDMMRLINRVWRRHSLRMQVLTYECVALAGNCGVTEVLADVACAALVAAVVVNVCGA